MTEAWLRSFSALSRSKKLKDGKDEKEVTDLFLSRAGVQAVRDVSLMAHPNELEKMDFKDIKELILAKMRPKKKLVIAERSKFMALRQEPQESARIFAQRIRDAARFCEFDQLNNGGHQSAEDELVQTMLVSGLFQAQQRSKVLQHIQSSSHPVTLDSSIDFLQQLELIYQYSGADEGRTLEPERPDIQTASIGSVDKNAAQKTMCKACGLQHAQRRCPAWGKVCNKCHKKNHFAAMCRSKSRTANEVETDEPTESDAVFSIGGTRKAKSRSIKTVLIEGRALSMQLDSGSDATIIPKNFWRNLGEPKLRRCNRTLRQFDGSIIETLGSLCAVIEVENKIACTEVIVAACEKAHGLLGTDLLRFNLDAVTINNTEEKPTTSPGRLRGFRARITLKERARPSYFEARPVPIHLKPLVVQKLRTLVTEGVLQVVPPGGSEWASPIVIVRKPDGDLRICADYKISVNPKICADSYPLPNTETAFCELAECLTLRNSTWRTLTTKSSWTRQPGKSSRSILRSGCCAGRECRTGSRLRVRNSRPRWRLPSATPSQISSSTRTISAWALEQRRS